MTLPWIILGTLLAVPSLVMVALPFFTRVEQGHLRRLERDRRENEAGRRLLGGDD